jgi:hypothetical protein
MSEAAAAVAEGLTEGIWGSHTNRDRVLLAIASIACYWVFGLVASIFALPRYPGFDASLLHQPAPIVALLVAIVTLVACTLLGSLVAGIVHFEAGLFAASIGLVALSTRGGPIRQTLFNASGPGVFVTLAIELIVLYAGIALACFALGVLRDRGMLRAEEHRDTHREREELPSQTALAVATQIGVMFVLMLLLAQADLKGQAVWSVVLASLVGTLAAHSLFPVRPAIWFLAGPLLLGLAGYAIAFVTGGYSPLGIVGGFLPQLARPLPVDYAAMGTAGTLLGYWISRGWHIEREKDPETEEEVEEALEHPNR